VKYRPPRWLPGGHAQTIWPVTLKGKSPPYRRERWETPDGDFVDLDWVDPETVVPPRISVPTVVLFHGLEGSSQSPYARELMLAVHARGWRGVVLHYRGCSGEPNRLPRFYHSADSAEIDWVLRRLAGAHFSPLLAVGISLGGNLILKWLGEQGADAGRVLCAAVAVCAPHDLARVSVHLERGVNRIYTRNFLNTLIPRALAKAERFPELLDAERIRRARNLTEYDEAVTAPVHGFRDAADYYARASAKPLLMAVRVPTLVLNAANDPFVPCELLPEPHEVSAQVCFELQEFGGHVGFVGGKLPGRIDWLPRRLLRWFDEYLPQETQPECG
jgi:predicted alpha/beta-fold hydrolase